MKFQAILFSILFSVSALASQKIKITEEHIPGELIVKVKQNSMSTQVMGSFYQSVLRTIEKKIGLNTLVDAKPLMTDSSFHKIKISDEKELNSVISALKDHPEVEFAEPNFIYRAFDDGTIPDDSEFKKLWGMNNTGQTDAAGQVGVAGNDINILPLWKQGFKGDRKVLVAVIDTGVQWDHPSLKANIYTNSAEVAGDGKDNDGNGFIDDVHGWNFNANTANSSDDHSHGTHCAGTIGASQVDGKGIVGVNWNVSILPVKFLGADGSGSAEGAINSINYARMMKVNVMSNSWGGGGYSDAMKAAIEKTNQDGIVFVAAAGNDSSNNDATPSYPASYRVPNVISVAAIDNQSKLASFSNYGARSVHVAAPGVKIYSSVKGGTYATFSGTSMATPHVAGISALMLSIHPEWKNSDVKYRLIATSTPVQGLAEKTVSGGRVNATEAVQGNPPPSDEPSDSDWKDVSFSVESAHPYADNSKVEFPVKVAGAKYIRVVFDRIETEAGFDFVRVESISNHVYDSVSGTQKDYVSQYVKGDSLKIRLLSDTSQAGFGFKVSKVQVVY